jgi:hypothetical protein
VTDISPTISNSHPNAVAQAWANGTACVVCNVDEPFELLRLRPLMLFAQTFGLILTDGTFRQGLKATDGLVASERAIREIGSVLFVHNPTEHLVTGSVFPAIEEVTVGPGETFLFVHDAVIGEASRYLAAYAGLVKSDAMVFSTDIRPDPYVGARVFVSGEIGTQREIVLFGAGRGESLLIRFSDEPTVSKIADSLVISIPEPLAARVWPECNLIGPTDLLNPFEALPIWSITDAGEVQKFTEARSADTPEQPGYFVAKIQGDESESLSARLAFGENAPANAWLNGETLASNSEVSLLPGENWLFVVLKAPGSIGPVTITPDGACYQLEVTDWLIFPVG